MKTKKPFIFFLFIGLFVFLNPIFAAEYTDLKQALKYPKDVTKLILDIDGIAKKFQNKMLPAKIGKMTNLEILEINSVSFTSLPPEIANCKNLKHITLTGNILLPKEIAKINIETIIWKASSQKLHSIPEEIFTVSSLQTLQINYQVITTIPEALNQLINLKKLDLSNNDINSISEKFGKIDSLQFLILSNNQLSNLSIGIKNLSNLQELNISNNHFSELPSFPFEMLKLSNFNYLGNPIKVESLQKIADSDLGKFHIYSGVDGEYNTKINDIINKASNVIMLSIYGQNNVIAFLKNAEKFNSLIYLDISGDVTIGHEIEILIKLPRLRTLTFTPYNGKIPTEIGLLSQVTSFNVDLDYHCKIMPRVLFEMTQLKHLSFSAFELIEIPNDISKLINLESLSVVGLFNDLPASISRLEKLKHLNLESTNFNESSIVLLELTKQQSILSLELNQKQLMIKAPLKK